MIRANGLSRRFGLVEAVSDVSFDVPDGAVFALLGPNGAGKTTTIRMLTCLIAPTAGSASFDGLDITRPGDAMEIRRQVGLLPESPGLYERLSAYKNLDFHARLYGVPKAKRASNIERLLRLLDVWERRDDAVTTFSKGMRQKIAIARALVHEPKYLFLDEPTASLDPEASRTVREFILGLRADGATVFLNTHNLDEAERVATRIAVLRHRLMAIGTAEELRGRSGKREMVARVVGDAARYLEAIEAAGIVGGRAEADTVRVPAHDPEATGPAMTKALVGAGASVVSVEHWRPSLEEVYLGLVEVQG
jgi:ABC-2 type transport system ATP-binding protein